MVEIGCNLAIIKEEGKKQGQFDANLGSCLFKYRAGYRHLARRLSHVR